MIRIERHAVQTKAGHEIVANFFYPAGPVKASVLIVSAMGVGQKFYSRLGTWLSTQGYLAATFDYQGTGLSRQTDLRTLKVNIADWARFDCEAMVEALISAAPAKPLIWLGHSLGGQIVALVPSRARIAKVVTVACGSGYWLENAPALRWRAWWIWYIAAPVATRLFGYFPGKRLRKVGDLPRGVIEQWRRWCLNPEYAVGVEGLAVRAQFAAVHTPITSLSFVDDEYMSARNTESMHSFYAGAPRTMKRIAPKDVGAKKIGHFGFFNAQFQDSLWRSYLLPELA
jgi:predicted alpha/beta hydrolase